MSKISVICKQQKPARILIKAAYRKQLQRLQFRRKQVENRFLPPVLGSAEDAGRLIKHEIAKLHIAERFAVKDYRVPLQVELIFRSVDRRAVYQHAPALYYLPQFLARGHAKLRQELIQSH